MTNIIPIIIPHVNMNALFSGAATLLGHSITRGIDNANSLHNDDAKIISAIAEFSNNEELGLREALREADHELFFLYYGFLVQTDGFTIATVREWTRLDITSVQTPDGSIAAIVAGNLAEWKRATRECCSEKATFQVRLLFDKALLYFESIGLGDVWFEYRRRGLPDKTFLIEHKK